MIWNYIKIAIRNLGNHFSYSLINLAGLSIGVAAALIIFLYSLQILTFDAHHSGKQQIYLAYKERITPNGIQETFDTWVPLGKRLQQTFPEVKNYARYYTAGAKLVLRETYFDQEVIYSDPSLFDVFTFEFMAGSGTDGFGHSNVAIAESIAQQYFNSSAPIGEEIEILLEEEDTLMRFIVSGVFRDLPVNSSIQPKVVMRIEDLPTYHAVENEWGSSFLETWIELHDTADPAVLAAQFPNLIESIWGAEMRENTNFKLLPLGDYYDTLIGDSQNAWIMLYIALGILVIAGINFMNLATARSAYRSKEIGVRKVMGAVNDQIRNQFLVESILFAVVSVLGGLLVVFFTLDYLNLFFDLTLSLKVLASPLGIGSVILFALLIGLFSGLYPALYLSGISIMEVVRHRVSGTGVTFRNLLLVVQFSLAVLLISGSLLVRNQLIFMSHSDMGFDGDQLLIINASSLDFSNSETGLERIQLFKNKVRNYAFVKSVSASRHVPTDWSGSFTFVRPSGWAGDPLRMRYTYMDAGFFPTYDIPLVQGRYFFDDGLGDQRQSVILNEAAYSVFNFDSTVAPAITIGSQTIPVVGVVRNFNYESLRNEVEPTLHFHRTMEHPVHQFLSVKLDGSKTQEAMSVLEEEWTALGSTSPFQYRFADVAIDQMYSEERRFLGLVSFFTIISILVACLGLYGLTVFVVEKRRKEISVRKVVGARLSEIVMLVFKDFAGWMLLAILIGSSLAYYSFAGWVSNFHYQAPINPFFFVLTAIGTLGLVLTTVGFQAVKAGLANPITYLRED